MSGAALGKILIVTVLILLVITIILIVCRRKLKKTLRGTKRGKTVAIEDCPPQEICSVIQAIPRIIIQTNQGKEIPIKMHQAIETIRKQNPEYTHVYYDDERARTFLLEEYGERYLKAYDDLVPGAYKADYFRYAFLCKRGGVYLDTGMVSVKPLRDVIKPTDQFLAPEDDGCGGIYNAFICSVPNHPVIQKCLDTCLHNIESRYMGPDTLYITGPDMMAICFAAVVGREVNPNLDYGNGVRLIYHRSANSKRTGRAKQQNSGNSCGEVFNNGEIILHTKYVGYGGDMGWYHTNEHYSTLWHQGRVYASSSSV
jgi:hypothetical protein